MDMRLLTACLAVLLVSAAAGCGGPAHQPPQPVGRVIACEMKVNGTWAFWLIYLDDGLQKMVSRDPDPAADWAPDGHHFVYSDGTRLRTARSDNADNRPLAGGLGFTPAWSPDGKEIAFGTSIAIQSCRVAGGESRNWYVARRKIDHPTWSPDGLRIAAMDASGDLVITDGTTHRTLPVNGARHPDWSPDGARILLEAADGSIVSCDPATGQLTPVGIARGSNPGFLRDGTFLTVWQGPDDDVPSVYLWDAAGTVGERLTSRDPVRNARGNW